MTKKNSINTVIAIGASAGGLDPLQNILKSLPDNLDGAVLLIAQHTSPNFDSMLANLLKKNTSLPVKKAEHQELLEPNAIYTCPPDTDVSVIGGRFIYSKNNSNGTRPSPSVDLLFSSIAKSYKDRAIGIIVSGTGHDGTLGIAEIVELGGVGIVQDPETASYCGMLDSAIQTDMIHLVLPPDQIGSEIPKLLDESYRKTIKLENQQEEEESHDSVKEILELLHRKTGADFSGYKTSTIHRRLEKRISDRKAKSLEKYIEEVKSNPEELDQLFLYLLIGVTQFFRNPESMEALEKMLKQQLMEHDKESPYRVWIPGCATGEEPYTIAMILDDLISKGSPKPTQIQIFATDIDQIPLNKARIGKYNEYSIKNMPEHYINKYFTKNDSEYIISQEIKKYILFSKHDLTSNPPFLRLNLVSCRNLLIYFNNSLQNQVIPLFHYTLDPNGILFLGKSETIGRFKNLFETLDIKHKIFKRRQADSPSGYVPLLQPMTKKRSTQTRKTVSHEVMTISDMVKETFYNGYEYPYIVVDDDLNVVEVNKDVSYFLSLPQGVPNLNAIKLVHKDLRLDLRTLVSSAHTTMSAVRGEYRKVQKNDEVRYTRLHVQPTLYSKPGSPYFIVSFESTDASSNVPDGKAIDGDIDENNLFVAELEHELASTKEHLNTLIEELETSNEELQSLNEELQSSNEELQASNEELETSNEELQATNEELNVAYGELREASNKIEDQSQRLAISQNNLNSLLDNGQQAFILINKDYSILHYNKFAKELHKEVFGTSLTTKGLYIDLLSSAYLQNFHAHFKETLRGNRSQFEQEVIDANGKKRYLAFNYTPVEPSSGSTIENVSVAFLDITDKKNYELALKEAYDRAEDESKLWKNVFEDSPEIVAIFSGPDYRISFANKSYKKLFPKRDLVNHKIDDVVPEVQEQGFRGMMDKVRKTGKPITKKEMPAIIDYTGTGKPQKRYFNFTYRPIWETDFEIPSIVLHSVDVTVQVNKRTEIEEEQKFLHVISNTLVEHVWVLMKDNTIQFINDSGRNYFGLDDVKELSVILQRVHEEDRESFEEKLKQAMGEANGLSIEYRLKGQGGKYRWFMMNAKPLNDKDDNFEKLIVSSTDINEQKVSQKNKDDFMGVASHELKTPLTSVKAYTQLLQEHLKDSNDSEAKQYLERTNSSVEKLEKFVSDLLDISRIQRGKLTLEKRDFDVKQLVEEVIDNIQVATKTHKVIGELTGKSVVVHADKERIEQVLVNLMINAIKYSPDADEVLISLKKKIGYVEIAVQDNGIGISAKDINNIFDRFYRVSEHQNKISGLGIGLNISREIVQLHNGQIWAESKLDKGSIFYVSIPLAED